MRHNILFGTDPEKNSLWTLAKNNLIQGAKYISSIPVTDENVARYRLFCMIPLLMAFETWKVMHQKGAEEVFKGNEEATKVTKPTLKKIIDFSSRNAHRRDFTDDFIINYANNPEKYNIP